MKKNFLLAAGMLFCTSAFIGCSNEENFSTSNEFTVKATMGVESRTELGADYSTVTWCAEDQIYLFGDGASATMRLMSGAGEQTAVFSGTVNGFPYKLKKSLYPVPTIENGEYSYTLPTERDYNSNSEAPLFGLYGNGQIVFQNLVAMMRIPMAASDMERVLRLNMEGIAGKLIVDVVNGKAAMVGTTEDYVEVTVPAGEACFIDIPVPAKTYPNGYQVLLDGVEIAKSTDPVVLNVDAVKVILNEPQAPEAGSGIDANYMIATSADLLWVAKQVNTGVTFAGKVLAMTADIDLTGINWSPIGSDGKFSGTFDGREHKISNLTVSTEGTASAGLFANAQGGLIKNLTLENVNITGHYKTGAIVGDGICAKVENCHVIGGTITATPYNKNDANNVGGIVGYLSAESEAWVQDCSVDGLTIKAYRSVAGIAGRANGANAKVLNNKVSNTTIIADQTDEYNEVKPLEVGEIIGSNLSNTDLSSNTATNVSIEIYVKDAQALASALTGNGKKIAVVLTQNIDLPIGSLGSITPSSGEYKLGSTNTESININLNNNKLNITTTYWSKIGAKNDNATIIIKNGTMTSSQSTGTWNSYDVTFANCNYQIENVVFEKAIAFTNTGKTVKMNNIVINEPHDYYALWISASGQNVEIDKMTINSGRGIKIDEQYVDTPAKVNLKVSNATFTTAKKAAILVKSIAGADITLSKYDISAVQADSSIPVWVDADSSDYFSLVSVTGGYVIVEP